MIPLFPSFKKLTIEDRRLIKSITKKYPPYSDFSFASLYCWNTNHKTEISSLFNNLVVVTKDYSSKNKIFSFLGNNNVIDTIVMLRKHSNRRKISEIKLIPEINILHNKIILQRFNIKEERDQFDYIYSLRHLYLMEGQKYKKKRNLLKRFAEKKDASLKTVRLNNKQIQKQIINLLNIWKKNKLDDKEEYRYEFKAIKNCFYLASFRDVVAFGLYIDKELIGFSINNTLPNNYVYTLFEKSNKKYHGASEYMMNKKSEFFLKGGFKLINYAQDLGIVGLRRAKESWRPVKYLKKYIISPRK